ncbi:hypothetical protein SVIOM74S_09297 [Streptomyces violarus]
MQPSYVRPPLPLPDRESAPLQWLITQRVLQAQRLLVRDVGLLGGRGGRALRLPVAGRAARATSAASPGPSSAAYRALASRNGTGPARRSPPHGPGRRLASASCRAALPRQTRPARHVRLPAVVRPGRRRRGHGGGRSDRARRRRTAGLERDGMLRAQRGRWLALLAGVPPVARHAGPRSALGGLGVLRPLALGAPGAVRRPVRGRRRARAGGGSARAGRPATGSRSARPPRPPSSPTSPAGAAPGAPAGVISHCNGALPVRERKRRSNRTTAHVRACRQRLHVELFVEVLQRPGDDLGERVGADLLW